VGRRSFLRLVVRRALLAAASLVVLSVLVFTMLEVLPGDPARVILGQIATEAAVERLSEQLGTDRPPVDRYVDWIGGALHGDFGTSFMFREPVGELVAQRAVNTITLALCAALLAMPLGVLLGILAGSKAGTRLDQRISGGTVFMMSQPEFLVGILLIWLFSVKLGLTPAASVIPSGSAAIANPKVLILPVCTVALAMTGYIARITRTSVAHTMGERWIRTARLKGLAENRVVLRHVIRNALAPTVTVLAVYGGWLLGGLVIVEALFAYPGLGYLMFQAASNRDLPLLEAGVLVVAAGRLTLSFMADVTYAVLDPRVRYR
jgi:peptide/nickel transport system permease protein